MAFSSFVVFLSVACLACGMSIYGRDKIVDMAEEMPCGVPQPRAFSVMELTNMALMFENHFVVLHRCDRAGCCADADQRCAPETIEKVTLLVGYYEDNELLELPIDVENHTSCVCRRNGSSIK